MLDGCHFQDLIERYSRELQQPADAVAATIEALRTHAVEKLAARNKFQTSGVATLKIKLAGQVPSNVSDVNSLWPSNIFEFFYKKK